MRLDTRSHSRRSTALAVMWLLIATLLGLGCTGSPEGLAVEASCEGCNVLFISIDTLRADHLGAYGYGRETSPAIDALAAQSVVFENAYSTSYHTADSHMSMFTSLYPSVHGVRNSKGKTGQVLSSSVSTLPEILQANGYATAGFHGGGNVSGFYGFARGFEKYRRTDEVEEAIDWIRETPERPFFAFVHTYHVHDPYTPQPPYDTLFAEDYQGPISSDRESLLGRTDGETFNELRDVFWSQVDPTRSEDIEHLKALYDGQIREIDARVGELIRAALEADERTVIVLVSDHGEEFYEHGKFLHDQLYEELLRVPLILRLPSGAKGRIEERVSLIDLAPTLLDVIGLEAPNQFQGSSLVPVLKGVEGRPLVYGEKVVQLSEDDGETELGGQGIRAALISDDWKVIAARTEELYYLPDDLQEQNNLASQSPEMSGLLELLADVNRRNAALRKELGTGLGDKQGLDEETLEELEALGYLGN